MSYRSRRGGWIVDQLLKARRAPLETLELVLLGRDLLSAIHKVLVAKLHGRLLSCGLIHEAWIPFAEISMLGACPLFYLWRVGFEVLNLVLAAIPKVLESQASCD